VIVVWMVAPTPTTTWGKASLAWQDLKKFHIEEAGWYVLAQDRQEHVTAACL